MIYTASREDYNSTNLQQLVGGSGRCHRFPSIPTRTLLCISREAALSAHYYSAPEKGQKQRVVVVYPTATAAAAAAAAAARPPQPINRAAVGGVGFCCRPFDYITHTAVVYPAV